MSAELYEEFHAKPAQGFWDVSLDWPTHWREIGGALEVVYRSDKWNDGVIDYVHPFGENVKVYAPALGQESEAEFPPPSDEVAWLGGLVELVAVVGDQIVELVPPGADGRPRDLPMLLGYHQNQGFHLLAIPEQRIAPLGVAAGEPLIICGSGLVIRDVGIVG